MHLIPISSSSSLLLVLLLHTLALTPVFARAPPSPFIANERRLSAPFQTPSQLQSSRDAIDERRPWTRLRDGLVQRLFRLPKHGPGRVSKVAKPSNGRRPHQVGPPSGLVARYSGDVVLRFNITTVDEAKAMAEATNILFLDVWESRDEWVDIRLAKDVVRLHRSDLYFTPHGS